MDLKNTYTEVFLKAAGLPNGNIEKYRSVWWCNLREKNDNGLRLTDQGIEFVETHAEIKTYNIDLPKELKITPQILVWLDHYIQSPFYLGKNYIKVMSEKSAFELYLFSGDIRKMGMAKAMNKRLSQN
jgi:hypothetical protein